MGLLNIDDSGVKPVAAVPPIVAPTSGVDLTGTPPVEEETDALDIFQDEVTGQPAVPVTVLQRVREAERAKREALEARLRELEESVKVVSATPAVAPVVSAEEEPSFDWSVTAQPVGTQQGQMPREQVQAYNEELRGRMEADLMGTMVQLFSQFYGAVKAQEEAMHGAARKFVPSYGELPLDDVTSDEMRYVASNPEVLKAVLAYLKKGKAMGRPAPVAPAVQTSAATPSGADTLAAAVEELRRQVGAVAASGGLSGEAPGAAPVTGAPVDWTGIDAAEKRFLQQRRLAPADLAKQLEALRRMKAGDRGRVLDV